MKKIQAAFFFAAVALINCLSLLLGFMLLDRTCMSKAVFPVVLSFFKHSLAISTCHSFTYAFIFRRRRRPRTTTTTTSVHRHHYLLLALILVPLHFYTPQRKIWRICLFSLFITINSTWIIFRNHHHIFQPRFFDFLFYWVMQAVLFLVGVIPNDNFSWEFVVSVSTFAAAHWDAPNSCLISFLDEILKKLMPLTWAQIKEYLLRLVLLLERDHRTTKLWASVLFQIFFPLSTSNQVSAMVLLALSWIASLTLLSASSDFGILSVVVEELILISCIHIVFVGRSWLQLITSCLNIGVCLMFLPLMGWLTSMEFQNQGDEHSLQVILWY